MRRRSIHGHHISHPRPRAAKQDADLTYSIVACAGLAAWLYLIAARGGFWQASVVEDSRHAARASVWPPVVAVVPARDEAELIADSLGSLLDQEYPGPLPRSSWSMIRAPMEQPPSPRQRRPAGPSAASPSCPGRPLPGGWTGKVWAMKQGADHAECLQTRRAICCSATPTSLSRRMLCGGSLRGQMHRDSALTSLMAKLRCESPAERSLIPAFVFFFQMLYPFQWVNRPDREIAAAAGGCMLVRPAGAAGGRRLCGDPRPADRRLRPGESPETRRSDLARPHRTCTQPAALSDVSDVGRMIARSAYEQLGRSPLLLAGTVAAMGLTYLAPPLLALFASGEARFIGAATWLLMALTYQPMLRFYRVNPLWGGLCRERLKLSGLCST